jgi:putative colanic acid biosynthesis UDP-glucose lipid carrier transferase
MTIILQLFNIMLICLSSYGAYSVRFSESIPEEGYRELVAVGILAFLVSTNFVKYQPIEVGLRNHLGRLILVLIMTFGLIFSYLVFTKTSIVFSRLWLLYWMVLAFGSLIIGNIVVFKFLTFLLNNVERRTEILLIGDPNLANDVKHQIENHKPSWFNINTFEKNINLKGVTEVDLQEKLAGSNIKEIWLCIPLTEQALVTHYMYLLRNTTVGIRQIPTDSEMRFLSRPVLQIGGVRALEVSCSPHYGVKNIIKRIEDVVLSTIFLVALSPVFIAVAVGVKLTSPGPILFKQKRLGIDGKEFKLYKFRSMKLHKEQEGTLVQATKNDSRTTKLGAFIRRTSLDELPQFYNVLQGRMSIVGPRPHATVHNHYYADIIESYMRRHMVKPGITGWAQLNGFRGETETIGKMEKRVEYDLFYIEHWSPLLDLKIIFLTPLHLFARTNAY